VLGKQTDHAKDEMQAAARAAEKLDAALAGTRTEIARLNKELAVSDDPGDVVKQLQQQYSEFDKISRIKKRIAKDDEDERKKARAAADEAKKAIERIDFLAKRDKRGVLGNTFADLFGIGKGVFGKFETGATRAATDLNEVTGKVPGGTLAKVGLGIAAAPALGAGAGGLALAGGALAGVGLGVGGAIANNPEPFRKAWSKAIEDISNRWQRASFDFQEPALKAFETIRKSVDGIDIEGILKSSVKYVEPLASGIAGFITPLGKGIKELVDKAGPVVAVLSKDLPLLGQAFQKAFGDIGDGADGAANALDDIIQLVGISVIAVGKFVKISSEVYDWGQKNLGILGGTKVEAGTYARALDGAKTSTDGFTTAQESLTDALKKASDALSDQLNNLLALDGANDAAATGIDRVKESFKQNGNAIDGNSKAALANRQVLQGVIGDYEKQRDAAIAAGDGTGVSIGQANAVLRKHLEELRNVLIAHGDDTSAVDKYIAKLDSLDGKVISVRVDLGYTSHLPSGVSLGNLLHQARGGESVGGPTVVGEHGPELKWLSRGDYISTAEETRKLASMTGSSSGGSATGLTLSVQGNANNPLVAWLAGGLRSGAIALRDGSGRPIKVA
jgi:hypothetical protein